MRPLLFSHPTKKPRITSRARTGFTLVEMAIVVLLVGILLTFGVGLVQSQLENAAIKVTKNRQDAIHDALVSYLAKYRRLPCPDSATGALGTNNVRFDGIEDRSSATAGAPPVPRTDLLCAVTFGTLPFATLGLSREAALDGWNNFFSYQVTNTPYDWTRSASFNTGNQGGIAINDRVNGSATLSLYPTPAVVVLVSHGKNGGGAFTVKGTRNTLPIPADSDQLQNTDSTAKIFIRREMSDNIAAAGGTYDDLVAAYLPTDLFRAAIANTNSASFTAQVTQATRDIDDIEAALIGYAIKNNQLPTADSNNDGIADAGVYSGNIPWQTLGVAANDPWAVTAPPAAVAIANRYRYSVTAALTTTVSKADFIAAAGNIVVQDGSGVTLTSSAPFVVYSRGRNNVSFFNNGTGNGAPCTLVAPAAPLVPIAPNCLGSNEVNNYNGTAPFVKAAMNLPPFFTTNFPPTAGYDDILEYVAKGSIDAKLP